MGTAHQTNQQNNTWGKIYHATFCVAWVALAIAAGQWITRLIMNLLLGERVGEPFWSMIFTLLSYLIAIPVIVLLPPRLASHWSGAELSAPNEFSSTPTSAGFRLRRVRDLGLSFPAYLLYTLLANILVTIFSYFPWFNADQAQNVGFSYFLLPPDRYFALIAIVFLAPIAEEIIFRGWLYGKLREKHNIIISTILVSLLFAFFHGQLNVGVSVFALSLMLCALRETTNSIWAGMITHIVVNGIAFYLIYVLGIV